MTVRAPFPRPSLIWTAGSLALAMGLAVPALWALDRATTTLGGIAVDKQFTVYGAYGAITFSALSGLLLLRLLPDRPAAGTSAAPTPVPARA